MNREDIIRMAVDAGIIPWTKHEYVGGKNFSASDEGLDGDLASLIQFAALVASAEREACIVDIQMHIPRSGRHMPEYQMAMRMIERIRARGQA